MASRRQEFRVPRDMLVFALAALFSTGAWANPGGATVVSGSAAFNQNGTSLTVTNSPNAIINWQNFSIKANETTRFVQQSAASAVLNRVVGADPSQILGALQSNGRVFLVNPAGILVGQGARIDVAGLVASTLNISNEDFLAGRMKFQAAGGAGNVVNQGEITTPNGGTVYLIAPGIENSGIIRAPQGEVLLAAGQTVQLLNTGTPDVAIEITGKSGNVTNIGRILADAGRIGLEGAVIRNEVLISADSVVNEGGRVFLRASEVTNAGDIGADGTVGGGIEIRTSERFTQTAGGTLHADSRDRSDGGRVRVVSDGYADISGRISAMGGANGGDGGFIETSATKVKIEDGAIITTVAPQGATGTWLIDPTDYTIAASGGDMTGSQLSTNLGSSNVTIVSSGGATAGGGDVNVNDAVSWSANTLTLTAARDVNINAVMTASGTSALALNPATANGADSAVVGGLVKAGLNTDGTFRGKVDFGARSGTGFLTINGNGYTVINSLGAPGSATGADLQGMSGNLGGFYALGSDIDASATSTWNAGAGFAPVGPGAGSSFTGGFDGLGHTITGLTVNRPTTDYVGLFGYVGFLSAVSIRNVGLPNVSVVGGNSCFLCSNRAAGGLVGQFGTVTAAGASTISNSYSTGSVTGVYNVGGLVGWNSNGNIINSYSGVNVTGSDSYAGGLVGINSTTSTISNSYSTGNVSGVYIVGGLAGEQDGTVSNSYSTGNVSASLNHVVNSVGGLVGPNYGAIINSYSTSAVSAGAAVIKKGALVGENAVSGPYVGTTTNSYAIASASLNCVGSGSSAGCTSLTPAQMKMQASFSGWDFANTWSIAEGLSYPVLKVFLMPLIVTVTAADAGKTYDGLAYSGGNGVTYLGFTGGDTAAVLGGILAYGGTAQGAINAGSYTIVPSGYLSTKYNISYVGGILTVTPAPLTVTANNASKTYDGAAYSGGNGVAYSGFVNSETAAVLGGTLAYGGTAQGAVIAGGYIIVPSGLTAGNYAISFVNGSLSITSAVPPSPPPPSPVVPVVVPAAVTANAVANTVLADTAKASEGMKTLQDPYVISSSADAVNNLLDVQVPPQSAISVIAGTGGAKTPLDVCGPPVSP